MPLPDPSPPLPSRQRFSCFVPGKPKAMQTGSVVRAGGRAFPVRRNTAWAAVVGEVCRREFAGYIGGLTLNPDQIEREQGQE